MTAEKAEILSNEIDHKTKLLAEYRKLVKNCEQVQDTLNALEKHYPTVTASEDYTHLTEPLSYLKVEPQHSDDRSFNFFGHISVGELKQSLVLILKNRLTEFQKQIAAL